MCDWKWRRSVDIPVNIQHVTPTEIDLRVLPRSTDRDQRSAAWAP